MKTTLSLLLIIPSLFMSAPADAQVSTLADGRVIEYITGDRSHRNYRYDHGGNNYHEHIAFATGSQRDEAIYVLRRKGFYIGSTDGGRHARGSYHYRGLALDVPFYPNNRIFGYPDNRWGEQEFSKDVRQALIEVNFTGLFHGAHV